MLLNLQQLGEEQFQQLQELVQHSQTLDGGSIALYPHLLKKKRETPNNILYYHEGQLVGFLSVFFFYKQACEASVLVHPSWRRQHIAQHMLRAIMPLLSAKKMLKIIFSMPEQINQQWLEALGFHYEQSDYHMVRQSYSPILAISPSLQFREAKRADAARMTVIDNAAFGNMVSDEERFFNLLQDKDYSVIVAEKDGIIIGKAHIRWHNDKALLSDIAIIPEQQKRGYGGALLSHCINQILIQEKYTISLDVETTNRNALGLYLRHGFKISKTHDYWSAPTEKIQELLR